MVKIFNCGSKLFTGVIVERENGWSRVSSEGFADCLTPAEADLAVEHLNRMMENGGTL